MAASSTPVLVPIPVSICRYVLCCISRVYRKIAYHLSWIAQVVLRLTTKGIHIGTPLEHSPN